MTEILESPWDTMNTSYVGYNSQIDLDAINVLKLIRKKKFNIDIASELNLPQQYVELLQCIFVSADNEIFDYGSSPRGVWMNDHTSEMAEKCDAYVKAWEEYYIKKWG